MNIDYQDRIDNYLLGRMSAQQRLDFEAELSSNAELKDQLAFTSQMMTASKSHSDKLAAIKSWNSDYKWQNRYAAASSGNHRNRHIIYWASSIAAVLIAGFFIVGNIVQHQKIAAPNYGSSAQSPAGSYDFPLGDAVLRSGSSYQHIVSLLQQQQYEKALYEIQHEYADLESASKEISQAASTDDERQQYQLQVIEAQQEDLNWLKVFALLGLDRKSEARAILNTLRQSEGYYQQMADSLYKRIFR